MIQEFKIYSFGIKTPFSMLVIKKKIVVVTKRLPLLFFKKWPSLKNGKMPARI